MSVLSKADLLEKLKSRIGEDTSDETIQLIEDVTDTINDYDNKTKDSTNWEEKYKENDKMWRQKYKDRFFNTPAKEEEASTGIDEDDDLESTKNLTYENLFTEEGKK